MKPIAVIASSAQLGGAELSLVPVVRELARSRRVLVYLPASGPLERVLLEAGAEIGAGFALAAPLARASRHYGVANIGLVAAAALVQQTRLVRALRRVRPAAVYCNGFRAQLGATVPGVVAGAPVVWHVRDFVPHGLVGGAWARLSRRTALVLANSSAIAAQPLLTPLLRPPLVIPNGIDLTQFTPRRDEPPGAPTLGMAAHLTAWKGHSRFLRLLAAVRTRFPDARGEIAGGAIYDTVDQRRNLDRVRAEIHARGLVGSCTVRPIPPDAMPRWLAALTVLVHCPDRPEPFGRALAEAMAVGVPIVVAAGGGSAEVVGDAAVVAPLGNEEAILSGILGLLADVDARAALAAAGQARARELFDERLYARRAATAVAAAADGLALPASDV